MGSILDGVSLNDAQREAVCATEGPLLILAGAGSGKTRVLTYRIAHMVADLGIEPHSILAITFTNKAAAEMRERIYDILGPCSGMWTLTFHSLCARMLRADGDRLGFTSSFSIYDDDDSKRLVKEIYRDLDINPKEHPIQVVRSMISKAKNELISAEEYAARVPGFGRGKVASRVYTALQERLGIANAMDFDDMLVNGYRLLSENPDVLSAYQDRFRYISVDEYQDTNHAQYKIARLLAERYRNLMVVGDDDQSIYSWRGADLSNILEFERDYPEAHVVKLEENYRSTGVILEAANSVIANNSQRKAKRLYTCGPKGESIDLYLAADERDEGRWIASEIERRVTLGSGYSDIAVFYRTNAQSRVLEDMLLRAGVPYKIFGGTRFFDRAEIRDVMAYLSLVVNPADDIAAKRIVNVPRRGIGKATVEAIERRAAEDHVSFMTALQAEIADESLSTRARNGLAEFDSLIRTARAYTGSMRDVVEMIVDRSGLVEDLRSRRTPEDDARVENIREFYGVVSEFEEGHSLEYDEYDQAPTVEAGISSPYEPAKPVEINAQTMAEMALEAIRAGAGGGEVLGESQDDGEGDGTAVHMLAPLMEWLALRSDLDSLDGADSHVTLMTVHSAKGLEFPIVFIAGMEEGIFPHASSIKEESKVEEERRLAYVAITRAREHLSIVFAQERSLYGTSQMNPRSRFVEEIPESCLRLAGVGSRDFGGTGREKRGSRKGIYGSGSRYEQAADADGRVFGSLMGGRRSKPGRPAEAPAEPAAEFKPGDRVDHKVFGRGVVESVSGDELIIRFERTGQKKKLLVGYAPIVMVG